MRGFKLGFGFGFTGGGGAAGWIGYLINALSFNTGSTAQTLTAPDPVLALDWEGTLTDFGGAVNASGDSVAPPVGSRLVTTVANGSVLGDDVVVNGDFSAWTGDDPDGWTPVGAEDANNYVTEDTNGMRIVSNGTWMGVYQDHGTEIGSTVKMRLIVHEASLGSINVKWGGGTTFFAGKGVGDYEVETVVDGNARIYVERFGTTNAVVSLVVEEQVLPTALDTASDGTTPLHPSVTTGGVTDYVFYPTHEVSTAYASDKYVWAEASDGSTRYYSSSGGTSAGSAPTFPTSGTVVDNDITWTYEGRYGLSGQRIEAAATQYLLNSETPATQTTGSLAVGDYVLWMEGTGSADLTAGTATISTTGSATDGTPLTFSVTVEGTVTVTVAGTEDRIQLEGGDFPTSIIQSVASTVTRSAVNLKTVVSDTNLGTTDGAARLVITPLGTGQVGKVLASYTDASNELSVDLTATTITLNKKVAGSTITATKTYTHADGEQIIIDFAYGSGGMSINSFVVGSTAGSAGTNAATSAAVLGTNIQFGASNNAGHINATFDTALKSYATEAQASTDIDDWSL